jgi:hypothetical protein
MVHKHILSFMRFLLTVVFLFLLPQKNYGMEQKSSVSRLFDKYLQDNKDTKRVDDSVINFVTLVTDIVDSENGLLIIREHPNVQKFYIQSLVNQVFDLLMSSDAVLIMLWKMEESNVLGLILRFLSNEQLAAFIKRSVPEPVLTDQVAEDYRCDLCHKQCDSRKMLNKHVKQHTCLTCSRTYVDLQKVKSHVWDGFCTQKSSSKKRRYK